MTNDLISERPATCRLIEVIIEECSAKHSLHPLEPDLNGDYNAEITFSVQELRDFLIENSRCWNALKYIHENMP